MGGQEIRTELFLGAVEGLLTVGGPVELRVLLEWIVQSCTLLVHLLDEVSGVVVHSKNRSHLVDVLVWWHLIDDLVKIRWASMGIDGVVQVSESRLDEVALVVRTRKPW